MGILYTKLKVFHFKDKLDSLPKSSSEILAPLHIRLKPTNFCCHKCRYCAYGEGNLKTFGKSEVERVFIPREKMMELIDDFIEMGVKALTFTGGGEPLLYPYMLDVLERLKDSRIRFSTLTNGSLLSGRAAEIFSKYGTWVRISMDGWDDQSYSDYRGVARGEYSKILGNIRHFKSLGGKCYLGVSLIVDKENASHVLDILKTLKKEGVQSVKLSACLVNDSVQSNEYHSKLFSIVRPQIEIALKTLKDDRFEIFDAYQKLDEKFLKDYEWCPYLQILPVIGADLNVYSCPDKAYNKELGLIGSIKDMRFKDFWFSDKNKFFRINPSRHCRHHCETNAKNKLVLEYLDTDPEHLNFV